MKELNDYVIPLLGLKSDVNDLNFEIGEAFWKALDYAEIEDGNALAKVKITRSGRDFLLKFDIKGSVMVSCDRCLELFSYPFKLKTELLVKLGTEAEELDDKVVVIDEADGVINISHYIYEFIMLSLPVRVVHKDGECNPEMLERISSFEHKYDEQSIEIDPRWDQLKKLMNK